MRWIKLIASVAGIGYLKGGGTLASILYCIIWYLLPAVFFNSMGQLTSTFIITASGIYVSNKVEADWGKDNSKIVIDEFAGMAITLLLMPHTVSCLITGLVLFRIFDIIKPFGIRAMEKYPKGWGVMADDVLSGVYAWMILYSLVYFNLLH